MVGPHMRFALLVLLAACGDNVTGHEPGLVAVTGGSPYSDGCNGAPQAGTDYPGMEVEPSIATDGDHLIAAWQQDRWSTGGASGIGTAVSTDGGAHWAGRSPAFTRCTGGDYERASDPWLSIGDDTYASAIAFDSSTARSVLVAAASHDGGASWDAPAVLIDDNDPDVLNDKDSVTADGDRAYVVWDRVTGLRMPTKPIGTGPTMLARAVGGVWEPARAIYDPGVDNQTIGNVIAVLPDGTLVNAFDLITMASSKNFQTSIAVIRSTDGGDTWSAPIVIAPVSAVNVTKDLYPNLGIRDGAGLPSIAADPDSGTVYIAWEDSGFSGDHQGIALVRSVDGGVTWSPPIEVNGAPDVPAFTPAVAVAADRTVGVFYYDTREDIAGAAAYRVTAWIATSTDAGANWSDERASQPFDIGPSLIAEQYWFLGDYAGFAARADGFSAAFGIAMNAQDPTDIYVRP
jgi:hypothetical protein